MVVKTRPEPFSHSDNNNTQKEMEFRINAPVSKCTRQGIESCWAAEAWLHGTCHKMNPKHLGRYVNELPTRHNLREMDTAEQMDAVFAGVIGKRLMFKDLVTNPEKDGGSDVFQNQAGSETGRD